jgi:hypothetical protein
MNFQTGHDLIQSKTGFILIKKIEIKYGFGGFEEMNNFLHRNLIRFEIYFELKIWEFKV